MRVKKDIGLIYMPVGFSLTKRKCGEIFPATNGGIKMMTTVIDGKNGDILEKAPNTYFLSNSGYLAEGAMFFVYTIQKQFTIGKTFVDDEGDCGIHFYNVPDSVLPTELIPEAGILHYETCLFLDLNVDLGKYIISSYEKVMIDKLKDFQLDGEKFKIV